MRKILTILLAAVMVLAMSTAIFAQTVPSDAEKDTTKATITITNAANGETYKIAKLFDASVTGTEGGSIAYSGKIPEALAAYFTADTAGNISATDALNLSDENVQAALKTWAEANVTAQAVSDGTTLEFINLDFGYYIITTTQGETLLTVDSTNPNASVIDKNSTIPINNPTKKADDDDVFIGQTVTYTVSFGTANYSTENGETSKQIVKYIISDNFASGALTDINVTSIKVIDKEGTETPLTVKQFNDDGKIEITWAENGESLYANGSTLVITYTGTVASSAAIDGNGNVNTVTIDYEDKDGDGSPEQHTVTETIYTYAIAVQKVDQSGNPLAGAKFQLPFYVNATADTDGAYIYAGTTAGTGLVNELTTPASGLIIVKGVQQGTYSLTETEAPEGYNKLTAAVEVVAKKTGATTTSTTTYLDEDGNVVDEETETGSTVTVTIDELSAGSVVVVNKTGAELPSTGGIGTTIFYIIGGILVIGAGVVLVTRRLMNVQ